MIQKWFTKLSVKKYKYRKRFSLWNLYTLNIKHIIFFYRHRKFCLTIYKYKNEYTFVHLKDLQTSKLQIEHRRILQWLTQWGDIVDTYE